MQGIPYKSDQGTWVLNSFLQKCVIQRLATAGTVPTARLEEQKAEGLPPEPPARPQKCAGECFL